MGTPIWTCLECLLVGAAGVASGLWALDSVGAYPESHYVVRKYGLH